ncbi:S-layer protein [Thermodesulfomicrobium sp. WS]|uniref:beta strand repeat-containing protein n=1 Tax=Thermodesulfomicrobium sp. WS TaxID=3004129 RepID=UPI0024935918|nr:hypothetical protein [Thermodesulfomicrobium sp. WS]BDV01801.1 S-layer protein [Thermodesulfomicrobium sp. WS]
MAMTTEQRAEIIKIVVGMFGAAPGATYLSELSAYAGKPAQLVQDLTATGAFTSLYPSFLTNEEFATNFITKLLGNAVTDAAAKAWAIDWMKNGLDAGLSRGQMIFEAIKALDALDSTDTTWGKAAKQFDNQVAVAEYYSVTLASQVTDLTKLQSVVASVTDTTDVSTPEKIQEIIDQTPGGTTGQTFTLTIGTDTLTGTAGNDTFVGGITLAPGTATEVNTLNNGDVLDGGAGTDTLQATLVDNSAPTLKNIENVDARFLVTAKTLSLASATGVEKVSVVNTAVAASTVSNIGAVGTFAVTNHTGANGNTVTFDNGTATKLNATFTNVGVVSATAAKEINVNFDDNVFTEATIAITNSNVNLQSATAGNDDVKTMTVVATGTNELKLTSGAGSLETLTVSGEGSLDVSETATTALKTLTSTAKGGVKVDATAGVLETATTGDGKDTITAVGANVKNISTGAGDDTVSIITSALTATAVVNLGAGNDKLTLSAAPTAGATLSGGEGTDTIAMAKAAYATVSGYTDAQRALISGFEVLEITDALGTGDSIDVSKLAGVTSFTAGAGVTSAQTAAVTGVTSGSTVTLAGAIANNGTLNVTVKDAATGTADVLNVVLNKAITDDGNDAAVTTNAVTINLGATGVETVNLEAKGVKATATSNDVNNYTFALTDNDLKALSVSGDQKVTFTAAAGMTKLETVDASANTAGVTIDTANAALTQTITLTGTAKADTFVLGKGDVLNAGAGDDTITLGNLSKVTGGAGKDAFSVDGVVITNGNTYGSITDFTVGETIKFTDAGNYAGSATLGAKITLAGTALFADYLQAAAAGTTAGEMKWFQFSGNTYVVNDASATAAFVNGTDQIVELVGLLDLSKSTVSAAGLLTFVEA